MWRATYAMRGARHALCVSALRPAQRGIRPSALSASALQALTFIRDNLDQPAE
jgi:hypothetical protein